MAKECIAGSCSNPVFSKKYCKFHQWMRPEVIAKAYAPKKRKRIKPISDRLASQLSIYNKRAKEFKREYVKCQATIVGVCSQNTNDVHHTNGRGENLLNEETWIAVCRGCHTWIHENPKESRRLKLLV